MKKLKTQKLFFLNLALFVLLVLGNSLFAQVTTGKIVGTVTDDQGMPLPGVTVAATSPKLIGQVSSITDSKGAYRLLGLSPGRYKLIFTLSGLKPFTREDVDLSIEQTLTVNIQMTLDALDEEVNVIGESPLIDVKSTTKGMTLSKETFEALPKGRNYDSLITVIAGVSSEDNLGGASVDGASGLENMYYTDGMDTTDLLIGQSKQQTSFEFVEEVQIKTSGYQAEFGGSLGGVVNVVTRSGGNEFSGELVGYFEGSALNGKERDTLRLNPFDPNKAEYVNYQDLYGKDKVQRWEGGFGLGGYIIKDKVWFYGSFMPVFRNTTRNVSWLSGDISSSAHTEKYKWYNVLGKISAQPVKGLRLAASVVNNYSTYTGNLPDRDGSGDSAYPFEKVGFDYPNWTATGSADLTLGSNFLLSIRGGYFTTDTKNQKLQPAGERYTFTDTNALYPELASLYPDYIRASGFENYTDDDGLVANKLFYSRTSSNLDLTYYFNFSGEHALKAGFQWVQLVNNLDNTNKYDYFDFEWDRDYVIYGQEDIVYKGQYGIYSVSYSKPPLGPDSGRYGQVKSLRLAFYLQDSWTIANKLTINFGVRAEKEDVPSYVDDPIRGKNVMTWDFADKVAPRLGLVYDVFGDSSLKVFGSLAIYYDVLKLSLADGAYGAVKSRYNYYTLDDPRWWTYKTGSYPGTYINREDTYLPSNDYTDPDMKAMSQREISLGLEKRLTSEISASFRLVRKSLLYTIEDIGVQTAEGTIWYIGNPGYGWNLTEKSGGKFDNKYPDTPKAKREYVALNLALEKRFSNNWMAGFSYTWSRLWGNYSGLANSAQGQLYPSETSLFDSWYRGFDKNLKPMDGVLWTDRPHFFKIYGSYHFNFGLTLGVSSSARSGVPNSRRVNSPSYWFPDGLLTDGRTPFLWTTDFYAEYGLKLAGKYQVQLSLNVSNIFDSKTAQSQYPTVNRIRIISSDDEKLAGNFDYTSKDYTPDPRFLLKQSFLSPISARIGAKFIF